VLAVAVLDLALAEDLRRDHRHVAHVLGDGLAVVPGEAHLLLHHAGAAELLLRHHLDEGGADVLQLAGDHVLQALDDGDDGDHRRDADDDAQRREHRAHEVGAERREGDADVFRRGPSSRARS
jgi:hypothetical protein